MLWALFLTVDGVALATAAGGYLAAYVSPGWVWWLQILAVGLPALAVGVLALMLVPVWRRRWGLAAVHLVVLLALGLRLIPLERVSPPPDPEPGHLALVTFNVPQSGPSREALADSMVQFLLDERPDVLLVQEARAVIRRSGQQPSVAVHLAAATDSLGYRLAVPERVHTQPGRNRQGVTRVALLVRTAADFEVLAQDQVRVNPDDPNASEAVRTRFRWQGRDGALYNVHLRSFGEDKPWETTRDLLRPATWRPFLRAYRDVYRQRAADVAAIAERVRQDTVPVIVAGDFNGTPNNWEYHRLKNGRTDAYRRAGSGRGATYRADRPVVRIDHVLVDPAWTVSAARVPMVGFSDHLPVAVRLAWADGLGRASE